MSQIIFGLPKDTEIWNVLLYLYRAAAYGKVQFALLLCSRNYHIFSRLLRSSRVDSVSCGPFHEYFAIISHLKTVRIILM